MLFAFQNGVSGDILVQKAPACTIETLAKAVTGLFAPGHEIKVIGIRHGEKMYETLLTNEECAHAIDLGNFYRVPCDKRDLNYDKYFKDGDKSKLRPMILKDIADRTGLDVSTISRVVNSKYVQTQFGIILLKSLFSEAMQTDSGEEVSSYEIKNILQECIDDEDKRHPLTDETLMDILNGKGYRIARRTVAKYREMLGIPVARLRKQI